MVVVAAVHAPLVREHLEEAPYAGVLFLLLTVGAVLLAVLLLRSDTPAVWTATAFVTLLALAAYLVSRTTGLPQLQDDVGNWGEALAVPALLAEALALAASAYALRRRR
jgi:hypothetical protein